MTATDISAAMASEASRRYDATIAAGATPPPTAPVFAASCLEDVEGTFHTVTCIDVLIHYPQTKVDAMLAGLASKATDRVVVSFAPSTPYYEALKRVGELFPKGAKATRAYLHREEDVEAALARAGWRVARKEMTATKFYFSRLFEAVPARA
jgi:magnesium-protoporphyrin O-methyltransferase